MDSIELLPRGSLEIAYSLTCRQIYFCNLSTYFRIVNDTTKGLPPTFLNTFDLRLPDGPIDDTLLLLMAMIDATNLLHEPRFADFQPCINLMFPDPTLRYIW